MIGYGILKFPYSSSKSRETVFCVPRGLLFSTRGPFNVPSDYSKFGGFFSKKIYFIRAWKCKYYKNISKWNSDDSIQQVLTKYNNIPIKVFIDLLKVCNNSDFTTEYNVLPKKVRILFAEKDKEGKYMHAWWILQWFQNNVVPCKTHFQN